MTPKILKLLRLIGSENQNEMLSALRFLKKELQENKISWNEFVDSMNFKSQIKETKAKETKHPRQFSDQEVREMFQQIFGADSIQQRQYAKAQAFQGIFEGLGKQGFKPFNKR